MASPVHGRTSAHSTNCIVWLLAVCLVVNSVAARQVLLFSGSSRDDEAASFSTLAFPPTLVPAYHLGFSFRTCSNQGNLINQNEGSDRLTVELIAEDGGRLRINVTTSGVERSVKLGRDLADDLWHDVDLKFVESELNARLDGEQWTRIAPDSSSSLFKRSDNNPRSLVLGGSGFSGCLLEGPSLRWAGLTEASSDLPLSLDRLSATCPLSTAPCHVIRHRGGLRNSDGLEPCWTRPCQNGGQCSTSIIGRRRFECRCPARYAGDRCQIDTGSLCSRPGFACLNGGTCVDLPLGNSTACHCPPGFSGSLCENEVRDAACPVNACLNDGACYLVNGAIQCVCPPGFRGLRCEQNVNDCETMDPASGPCLNGGTCLDGVNSFNCLCQDGFRGERCERKVDNCLSSPCQNNGVCFDRYSGYTCQCAPGFTGDRCQIESSARLLDVPVAAASVSTNCEPDSCLNGGTCFSRFNDIECSCPDGFTGTRCQFPSLDCTISNSTCPPGTRCIDDVGGRRVCAQERLGAALTASGCLSEPCRNNGTCSDVVGGAFRCSCQPGFGGTDCSIEVDLCDPSPCQNGATCVREGSTNYSCLCPRGFEGVHCELDVDDCNPNPCIHASRCIDQVDGYSCQCESGWTGKNCDADVDECADSPCSNNATCVNGLNGFTCQCLNGFLGDRCEINRDDCLPSICQNGGTCIDGIANYTCQCPPEFMGRHCEDEFDACADSPCQNGASCITTRPSRNFYCECLPGFEGVSCEHNIDECRSVQCSDGKVCFDLINGFECRCPVGFTGSMCSTNINECAPNPCTNGATCIDGIGNYTCVCPPGFTGPNCSEDIDECEILKPCVFGICQNTIGSYQCYCRPGFSGDNCNLEFDECLSHPCQNNGTCNNLINGYECVCAPGFTGKDCDININECESSPCQNNGSCVDGIAAYSCVCLAGFTGARCEINIDECESSPCQNDGLCIDGVNSYQCDCSDTGFKGEHCEINVDDCESAPCLHGSHCVDLIKDYQCDCHPGYEGKNCQVDVNECESQPCQNAATCFERSDASLYLPGAVFSNETFSFNTSGGYLCRCLPGFEGANCEVDIDECLLAKSPCKFGTCIDGINNYTCLCSDGYEGDDCELEIDECRRFEPCQNGASCVDKVADYECRCAENYGGKNCSVELLGCVDVSCLHGGICVPFLENETEHKFTCQCPFGFHGQLCQHATTMSFNGSSYMPVQTTRDEGYDLSFRFRTTLPNGLLAVGQGQTYYRLELSDGQLNLHSSLLNKWEGVFLGSKLNDADWQTVRVRFNFTHLHLVVNQEEALYPINPVESINSTETSFGMTVLGGATSFLRILAQGLPFFVGCMENVVVNGQWVIPASPGSVQLAQAAETTNNTLHLAGVGVEMGCPRTDHCRPNPCQNGGACNDLWTFFNCSCRRPFLGDTCQFSYKAATFGHENATNSLVSVSITPQERLALSNSMDVSLFVRTREMSGLIFYMGTPPSDSVGPSYIAAELQNGKLVVVADLGDGEQLFPISGPSLNDGFNHLIQVVRDRTDLRVRINGTSQLNDSLTSFRPLQAQVLFLGGLPPSARLRRQTFSSQLASGTPTSRILEARNFKGVLQDIQIKSGNITRIVEIFPLDAPLNDLPESLGEIQRGPDVLEGVVSDDTCRTNPCVNGGNCTVTWNDFQCVCPTGFKGKTCAELEFCAIHSCPTSSECRNLNDGYECIASATFNGANTTVQFVANGFENASERSLAFTFRSRRAGTVLTIKNEESSLVRYLRVDVELRGVVVRWMANGQRTEEMVQSEENVLEGEWKTVEIPLPGGNVSDWVVGGQIVVGGGAFVEDETTVVPLDGEELSLPSISFFRGCLREVRLGGVLLPFFDAGDLLNDTSARNFRPVSSLGRLERECKLCFDEECQNGAICVDPSSDYRCDCFRGFEGDVCEVNVDECVDSECVHGSCVDGVANYSCRCEQGWTGWLCDEDINECEPDPCQNNATCENMVGRYFCHCTDDFVGVDCEKPRIVTCSNEPCRNGALCSDVVDPVTGVANNYTCQCTFGYEGTNCDVAINYCQVLDPCRNGATCSSVFFEPGYICECADGFSGDRCEVDVNECEKRPCLNGGRCIDGANNFTCDCTGTGYEGYLCEVDVDECRRDDPCVRGRCINSPGSYSCICEAEDDCGRHCDKKDPCVVSRAFNETLCLNDGTCTATCDSLDPLTNRPTFTCSCKDGYKGPNCSEPDTLGLTSNLKLVAIIVPIVAALLLIILVGAVVFVMMARNKRATRGTYSPSRQEMFSPRVEMGQVMKPPPEERLI